MTSPIGTSVQSSYLKCTFLGDTNGICVSVVSTHWVVVRKVVECKKQPITVPSNVTLTLEGQDLKVKGPLGELALPYPREIMLDKEDSGALKVKKTVETKRPTRCVDDSGNSLFPSFW